MSQDFDRFDAAIQLNATQRERVAQAIHGLRRVVGASDGVVLDTVRELVPQGSFTRNTILKPLDDHHTFDVDLLAVGSWSAPNSWGLVTRLGAQTALRMLATELRRHHNYTGKVHQKARCVRVEFANQFHLDVVPAVESGGAMEIPDKATDAWVRTNP
ncbi:MAG: hypothetical protein FJ100_15890 [Deltaproteobacteria bacterium]|nr:hypothetical protein [Deltaproteobacteria bacterium]